MLHDIIIFIARCETWNFGCFVEKQDNSVGWHRHKIHITSELTVTAQAMVDVFFFSSGYTARNQWFAWNSILGVFSIHRCDNYLILLVILFQYSSLHWHCWISQSVKYIKRVNIDSNSYRHPLFRYYSPQQQVSYEYASFSGEFTLRFEGHKYYQGLLFDD